MKGFIQVILISIDGTKTQSPEFSNSIFLKFLGHSFLYFKLLIYLPQVKRPNCFRGFSPSLSTYWQGSSMNLSQSLYTASPDPHHLHFTESLFINGH